MLYSEEKLRSIKIPCPLQIHSNPQLGNVKKKKKKDWNPFQNRIFQNIFSSF